MSTFFKRSSAWAPLDLSGISRAKDLGQLYGERVLPGPAGTYVTITSGKFSYRKKPLPTSQAALPPSTSEMDGDIKTASVDELQEITGKDCLLEIQEKINSASAVALFVRLLIPLFVLSMVMFSNVGAKFVFFVVTAGLGYAYAVRVDRARVPYLFYDLDNPELLEKYVRVSAIGAAMHSSQRLWHITSSAGTTDYKYNAGANHLIGRTSVRCGPGTLGRLQMNIEPWCIPVGPQRLLFLPDRLLVLEGDNLAGVPYEDLSATRDIITFVETEGQPTDAREVGSTWRFTNKDGSRDRRFNNNVELPLMEYGELQLRSHSGVNIVIHVSSPEVASAAAQAVNLFAGKLTPEPANNLSSAAKAVSSVPAAMSSLAPTRAKSHSGDSPIAAEIVLTIQDALGSTLTIGRCPDSNQTTVLVKAKNKRSVSTGPTLDRAQANHLKTALEDAWKERTRSTRDLLGDRRVVANTGWASIHVNNTSLFLSAVGPKHAPKIFAIEDQRVLKKITAALSSK